HMSQGVKGADWQMTCANLHTLFITWLGEEKIPGYELNGKYGLLIRTATTEIYTRFDGDVEFDITLSKFGTYHLKSKTANSVIAKIPELVLDK
ncbi:MAG: hypothetical protein JXR31_05320, partial [Prolixibacteraceae bacterium]|nr:hypothetical protein [Prolixibacteraceae bacterium]